MITEDFGDLISEIRTLKSFMEAQFDKIRAKIKEIGGKVTDLEIKVEGNLQSAINLQNKIKRLKKKKKRGLQRN